MPQLLEPSPLAAKFAACVRRGYYLCGHCSRISHVGEYFEDTVPACPHCHRRGVMEWHPPVLDEHAN
jgi:DNA-directed RNA polymerase subunit RPC12/RpoP